MIGLFQPAQEAASREWRTFFSRDDVFADYYRRLGPMSRLQARLQRQDRVRLRQFVWRAMVLYLVALLAHHHFTLIRCTRGGVLTQCIQRENEGLVVYTVCGFVPTTFVRSDLLSDIIHHRFLCPVAAHRRNISCRISPPHATAPSATFPRKPDTGVKRKAIA